MNISDQVRAAINNCGLSRYAVSKITGVSEGMLSRFVAGQTDMTLRTLDRLASTIGVRVVVTQPKRRAKKGG